MPTDETTTETEFTLDLAPTEKLFPVPLTLKVPGVGSFELKDRANPPREDEVNPETKPVSYMVEYLARQVVDDERESFIAALTEALDEDRIMVTVLPLAARWISGEREKAEKRLIAKKAKRPTTGRARSSR